MTWSFHGLRDSGRRGTLALQAIFDLCTKYNLNEPVSLVEAQTNIEDGISTIPRVAELTDQLAEPKKICLTHEEHDTEVPLLNNLASQQTILQHKTADTLDHASGDVVF